MSAPGLVLGGVTEPVELASYFMDYSGTTNPLAASTARLAPLARVVYEMAKLGLALVVESLEWLASCGSAALFSSEY